MKPAKPKPRPKVRNPFYKGATPERVARALMRHRPEKKPPRKAPAQ